MKQQWLFSLLLLVGIRAADTSTVIALDEAAVKTLGIETEEVIESDFEETAFALGEIVEIPNRHSVLSSRIPGRITAISVQEGDTVTAGQPLVTVESRQPGNPPPSIQLKAPMAGLVVESHVRLGEPVEPDKELLDISDLGEVWAIARVPQHHAGQLAPGARAHLMVPALGAGLIEGEMLRFGTTADPTGGTIDAVFRVANPGLRMRPGMRVEFNIVLNRRAGVVSVPRTALQGGPADRHVFVTDFDNANLFHRIPVRAGQISGDRVEILTGLFPGDQVVTTGSYPLGFAGAGSVSVQEALEAVHGHKHNADGSEPTAAEEAAQREAAQHAGEDARSGAPPWRERLFMATTAVLALLLVVMSFVKRSPEAITTDLPDPMLNFMIRWSLANRALIVAAAIFLLLAGYHIGSRLPVEVLPDLTKPTVIILVESPGLSPEEVESQITQPIESSLMGVAGLTRLRSTSDIALSLVYAEFDWGTDIFRARQLVQERLQVARESLPPGIQPYLTPVASLMGEILLIGIRSEDGKTPPMEVRSIADWTVRRRLQSIPGIAEVLNMGGGVKQAQVQPDPWRMQAHDVTLEELKTAVSQAASNTTGGFIGSGAQEIMVRNLAMTTDLTEISQTVIKTTRDRPIAISDVASVIWDVEPVRGNASIDGVPGVIMSVTKAPGFDTIGLTEKIEAAIAELNPTLPTGVQATVLFRQRDFIDNGISNLSEAIRDGAIMVTIVLFLFLLNFRTTFVTLMAMPLSFAITLITFKWLGLSVNSMTLGGLAVAIGMVVDDAIVDVENVHRRLRENASRPKPKPKLQVIAEASGEVRNSIFYATVLIILVFLPLLGLAGVEGRLFGPIAIATIISMVASFLVSLTVIPVLCSLVLRDPARAKKPDAPQLADTGGWLVRGLKWLLKHTLLRLSLDHPLLVLGSVACMLLAAASLYPMMGRDFLPTFHEETVIITTGAAPGTALGEMEQLSAAIETKLRQVPEVHRIGRRIGRAERSDHIVPISNVEFDVDFKASATGRSREEVLKDIRTRVQQVPGSFSAVAGPLSHRISHMLSGVTSPVAIKIFGPDLEQAREIGKQVQEIASSIPGLEDARLDQQASIPQLRIEVNRERAHAHGVTPGSINDALASLLGGETITQLRDGQRTIDLAIRLPEAWRENPACYKELPIETLSGRRIPLGLVADIREAQGPNAISRENTQRRFIVAIKPTRSDAGELVADLERRVKEEVTLPTGVYISYEGDFQAEQAATRRIGLLFAGVLGIITLLLWRFFRSFSLALQVLVNLPLALMGSLVLTWWLIGNISIATLVGFIAVGGVAARNGIMMLSHYLHLIHHEGEGFTRAMIERGTLERLVPVTMTALAAGIALVPLMLAAGEPGKEILHPVAVCIVGGLVTSTLVGFAITPALFRLFGRKTALRSPEAPASL